MAVSQNKKAQNMLKSILKFKSQVKQWTMDLILDTTQHILNFRPNPLTLYLHAWKMYDFNKSVFLSSRHK